MCVPLGLKKPGDFTVSEGIRLQIFRFFGGWVWSEGKKKRQARAECVRPSRAPTSNINFTIKKNRFMKINNYSFLSMWKLTLGYNIFFA